MSSKVKVGNHNMIDRCGVTTRPDANVRGWKSGGTKHRETILWVLFLCFVCVCVCACVVLRTTP